MRTFCPRFAHLRRWTRDNGPATATSDPRPATISQTRIRISQFINLFFFFETSVKKEKKGVQISGLKNITHRSIGMICSRRLFVA